MGTAVYVSLRATQGPRRPGVDSADARPDLGTTEVSNRSAAIVEVQYHCLVSGSLVDQADPGHDQQHAMRDIADLTI